MTGVGYGGPGSVAQRGDQAGLEGGVLEGEALVLEPLGLDPFGAEQLARHLAHRGAERDRRHPDDRGPVQERGERAGELLVGGLLRTGQVVGPARLLVAGEPRGRAKPVDEGDGREVLAAVADRAFRLKLARIRRPPQLRKAIVRFMYDP